MAERQNRISTRHQPVFNAAGLKGAKLGWIGIGTEIIIDMELAEKDDLKRTYVPIVGPVGNMYPTWMETGEQAWIELANTVLANDDYLEYVIRIKKATGEIISTRRIR
jgi:hypothetical protein